MQKSVSFLTRIRRLGSKAHWREASRRRRTPTRLFRLRPIPRSSRTPPTNSGSRRSPAGTDLRWCIPPRSPRNSPARGSTSRRCSSPPPASSCRSSRARSPRSRTGVSGSLQSECGRTLRQPRPPGTGATRRNPSPEKQIIKATKKILVDGIW